MTLASEITDNQTAAFESVAKGGPLTTEDFALVSSFLFRYCYKRLRHRDDASEAAQDALADLQKNARKFDESKPARRWVCGHARVACMRKNSERGKVRAMERSYSANGKDGRSMLDSLPAANGHGSEPVRLPARILDAMSKLKPRHREAVEGRYIHQLTFPEVGKRMNCTAGAAASAAVRGLASLRQAGADMPEEVIEQANAVSAEAGKRRRIDAIRAKSKAASISVDVSDVLARFNRVFPRMGELDAKLRALEVLLGGEA
jgi:RNA polymerase sigma factor (sigma-70 family)